MQLLKKALISLSGSAKERPGKPHVGTIRRYAWQAVEEHVLETVAGGGCEFINREACHRFPAVQIKWTRNPAGCGF